MNSQLPVIRVEHAMRPDFLEEIFDIPGGENIKNCIQCGTCSGSCPASPYMDHTPRAIMAMIRAGMRDDVLASNTIWMCASCYLCAVRCPAEIKITDIMYALKRVAVHDGKASATNAHLAKCFVDNIVTYGRNDERLLIFRYYLGVAPMKFLGLAPTGLTMIFNKRLPMGWFHKIKRIDEIQKIVRFVEEAEK